MQRSRGRQPKLQVAGALRRDVKERSERGLERHLVPAEGRRGSTPASARHNYKYDVEDIVDPTSNSLLNKQSAKYWEGPIPEAIIGTAPTPAVDPLRRSISLSKARCDNSRRMPGLILSMPRSTLAVSQPILERDKPSKWVSRDAGISGLFLPVLRVVGGQGSGSSRNG